MGQSIWDERAAFAHCLELDELSRAAFLERLAAEQSELADRLRRLLAAHEHAQSSDDDASIDLPDPGALGPYRLLERLGEGGMGVVFLAEQREPVRRRVAVKVLRAGLDNAELIARFENERHTMALMSHPGIARVLDAGASADGLPYYVMEYVPGQPATEFADMHRLSIRDRIELFLQVLDAVRHAHLRGVIHRDLKPSNILVQLEGQRPVVTIIDFGVAKVIGGLAQASLHTRAGVLLGTPHYMSPEQADARVSDVDVRSDIYSLGMVLFELLVGELPFSRHPDAVVEVAQTVARIKAGDLPAPSAFVTASENPQAAAVNRGMGVRELRKSLRGELDWIVTRAIHRDVRRRYESASDLADDLRRYLDGQPVHAGPASVGYRLRKFAARHAVGVAALVATALAGVTYTTTLRRTNVRINDALGVAEIEAERATAMSGILTSLLAAPRLEGETADTTLVRTLIARGLAEAQRLRNQPERQGHLYSLLGNALGEIGDYEGAIELLESARSVQRSFYGSDHINVAATERRLAENYRRVGRYAESREVLERVLAVERGRLPPDHARIAATLTELHFVHRDEGDLATAETILLEALTMRERLDGGAPSAEVAESLNLLGAVQRRAGRLQDSRTNYERALAIRRRLHPDGEHQAIAESLNNLGVQASDEGDLAGADTLLAEAARIFAMVLGESHPFVSISLSQRTTALRGLGRHEDVIAVREAMLRSDSVRVGPYHQTLAQSHLFIAASLRDLGRLDEARAEYEAAERHMRLGHGPDHPYLGVVLHSRARLHLVDGDPAEGIEYVDRALEAYGRSRPRLARPAVVAWRTKGELLVALGRDEAARDALQESLARAREAGFETLEEATGSLLREVYQRLGDEEGADSLSR